MKIRHKLLVLLLIFSVTPLLLSVTITHIFFYRSGMHLAEETERELSSQAHVALQKLTDSFQQIQERDRRAMEAALSQQAGQQSVAVEPSPDSLPPLAYNLLQNYRSGTISRQYTILETGRSSCYPSARQCFTTKKPRQLPWYLTTRHQQQTRMLANDPVSGELAVIIAKPLTAVGGKFIGAIALSRPVKVMLEDLKLTENWFGEARELLVSTSFENASGENGLRILAVRKAEDSDKLWQNLHAPGWLQPDKPEDKKLLLQRIAAGKGGSLKMSFQGVEAHWIFSAAPASEPFALILVPHAQVIANAVAARDHVVKKTLAGLAISVVLLLCVVTAVFFTAILASKKVTRPLRTLATAAEGLAGGNFEIQVAIKADDEVAELGRVFNLLGPELAERERMASSLALAGDVQRHLLPQVQPRINGFEIFGGSLSCDETGGDYYDFISLRNNHLALAVGDVSGHGVGAALTMAGTRGVLRSHASRRGLKLPTLFKTLNEHLCQDTADEQFMTLYYGVLTASDRSLRWCSAGHGPHFLYRCRDKSVAEFGSTGLPLGVMVKSDWEEGIPIIFATGDILLVGTDGIWETHNPQGEELGTERLKALLCSRAGASAAQIHASVMALVRQFRMDGYQEDDITLTVIKAVQAPVGSDEPSV